MCEFTFNQFQGWTSNYILVITISAALAIRALLFNRMRLQITRYYFPYKETNQIMSFEFGL